MAKTSRRDHLVDTALELFYANGFHATGIDKILKQSGVAKMTLYNHFKSKDQLILAVLRRRDERFRAWLKEAVERRAETPRERLLALFDALEEWFNGPDFFGCMFINASAEFAKHDDPVHAVARLHKRLVLSYVRDLAAAAGAAEPEALARQLELLMEGATVVAQIGGSSDAAQRAKQAAETLIAQAVAGAQPSLERPLLGIR